MTASRVLLVLASAALLTGCPRRRARGGPDASPDAAAVASALPAPVDAGPPLQVVVNFGLVPASPHADQDTRLTIGVRNVGTARIDGLVLETHTSESVTWVGGDSDIEQRGLFSARTWPTTRAIAPGDLAIFHLVFRPEKAGRMRVRVGVKNTIKEAGTWEVEQSVLVTP